MSSIEKKLAPRPAIITPWVAGNVGGSGADALLAYYEQAEHALEDALAHLRSTGPHARDFRTAAGWEAAAAAHRARVRALEGVAEDMRSLAAAVRREAGR